MFSYEEESHSLSHRDPSPNPAPGGPGLIPRCGSQRLSRGAGPCPDPFPARAPRVRLPRSQVVCRRGLVKKNKQRSNWRRFLSTQAPPPAREMQTAGDGPSQPGPPRPSCGWEGRARVTRAAAPAPRALPSACPFAPDPAGGASGPYPPSPAPPTGPGPPPAVLGARSTLSQSRARAPFHPPPGESTPHPLVPRPHSHMAPVSNAPQWRPHASPPSWDH